ncbi:MAG: ornithine carbamoyltransferase [Acidimicrobiales bacterium]|nr:ornithine carbamoyltransferase [Acidimicrobiales bacterium]
MSELRHFLEIDDLSPGELARVLELSGGSGPAILAGRTAAFYFEKPSLRTRHSAEAATVRLGGHPVTFTADEVSLGEREPVPDAARVLSGYHALLGARVFDHALVETLAAWATVPVVNLLSDLGHPCQALADLLTMRQEWGSLSARAVAWVGDYNNVARSLAIGSAMSGMDIHLACPTGYGPTDEDLDRIRLAGEVEIVVTDRPDEAATGADAVHTDVWASMGQESEADVRFQAFEGFQVDDAVMAAAPETAIFMHCLPAHRGEEVAASVADGPQSRMIRQAHNRMHAKIGLFRWLHEVGALGDTA